MWMVDPKIMCNKHLCGEHGEIHKHRHNFVKGHKMTGRILANCCEPSALKSRHDELEKELNRRQIKENRALTSSPFEMPDISYLPPEEREYVVNVAANKKLLLERCEACRQQQ
jgi:hypothetical protein